MMHTTSSPKVPDPIADHRAGRVTEPYPKSCSLRGAMSALLAWTLGCGGQTTAPDPSSPGPVAVQPDGAQGVDVWITSVFSYDDDFGVDDEKLQIGGWADWYHTLIRFDLAGLPSVAASATLELQPFPRGDASTPVPMELYRVTDTWSEATGWFTRPASVLLAGLPAPATNSRYPIDLTALYNDWRSGAVPNHGIELRPTANDNRFNVFRSSDYRANPAERPRLTVVPATGSSADRFTWPTDPTNNSRGMFAACGDNPLCFWLNPGGWRDVQPFLKYPLPGTARYHLGADWNRGSGSEDAGLLVHAIGDGLVVDVVPNVAGFGNVIFIQHKTSFGEYLSMYAHLEWLDSGAPTKGKAVTRGDSIARVGNTVGSGVPVPHHLHLEIRAGVDRTIGNGYTSGQGVQTPQRQIDPNHFIASHR